MDHHYSRLTRAGVASAATLALALVSGCGADKENAAGSNGSSRPPGATSTSQQVIPGIPGGGKTPSGQPHLPSIDWEALLANPASYLLEASGFPAGYSPRTLSLAERGQAIQDVGRAGVGVENFPENCMGAGGRIGNAQDDIAMQMASQGNSSLTVVIIADPDPTSAVERWAAKNRQCPTFLSRENGVGSKVSIEPASAPTTHPDGAVGFRITTLTTNFRANTVQEQLIYVIPMGNVVIEVMGMAFNGSVREDDVASLFQEVVKHSAGLQAEGKAATDAAKNDGEANDSAKKDKPGKSDSPEDSLQAAQWDSPFPLQPNHIQ